MHSKWSLRMVVVLMALVMSACSGGPQPTAPEYCMHELSHETGLAASERSSDDVDAEPEVIVMTGFGDKKATAGERWQEAEGTGLEPATPEGAPVLQTGR